MKQVNLKIKDEVLHVVCDDIFFKVKHVILHFNTGANIIDIIKMSINFELEFYKYADGHCALTCPTEAVFNIKYLPNE